MGGTHLGLDLWNPKSGCWVEEEVYTLALWWEIRPVVRRIFSVTEIRRRTEVRGDTYSRAEKRVGKELIDAGTEERHLPDDGRLLQ